MSDQDLSRLEHQIGRVLRAGVNVSATVLVIGLAVSFSGMGAWGPRLLDAGLILLMAIPVTRILASFADAVRRRDTLLVWATGIVVMVLVALFVYVLTRPSG
jgi:uncharacterized membrane protein